jgi:5-methylcytosine-specific restriction endonuclease McrA
VAKKWESVFQGKVLQLVERRALRGVHFNIYSRRRLIIQLAVRDGKCCTYCHRPVKFMWEKGMKSTNHNLATFEHKKTKSSGGRRTLKNGLLACFTCNNLRGTQDISVFLKRLADVGGDPMALRAKVKSDRNDRYDEKHAWIRQKHDIKHTLETLESLNHLTPLDNFINWLTLWSRRVIMGY